MAKLNDEYWTPVSEKRIKLIWECASGEHERQPRVATFPMEHNESGAPMCPICGERTSLYQETIKIPEEFLSFFMDDIRTTIEEEENG